MPTTISWSSRVTILSGSSRSARAIPSSISAARAGRTSRCAGRRCGPARPRDRASLRPSTGSPRLDRTPPRELAPKRLLPSETVPRRSHGSRGRTGSASTSRSDPGGTSRSRPFRRPRRRASPRPVPGAVDEVNDERHRDAIEPAVAERQPFGRRQPDTHACRNALPRHGDHLRRSHRSPRPSRGPRRRGPLRAGRCRSRHRERVAREVAELDERVESSPPRVVSRAQRVVDAGPGAEVRNPLRAHDVRSDPRPRPRVRRGGRARGHRARRNGISIRSKSFGTTVFANSCRASSAASPPK